MSELQCPHCHKPIYDIDALNCLYCGKTLECNTGFLSRLRYPGPKIIFVIVIIFVIISFLILIIG